VTAIDAAVAPGAIELTCFLESLFDQYFTLAMRHMAN